MVLRAEKRFSEITQVLFGMKAVDDLEGFRKLICGDVPDPTSTVTET
jgi:hypothetical protein